MLIYRIEDRDGFGPYYYGAGKHGDHPIFGTSHQSSRMRPTCENDPRLRSFDPAKETIEYRFGCTTEKGLFAWFRPFLRALEDHGFNVALYKASEVKRGTHQVAFAHASAARLVRRPIKDWRPAHG